MRRRTRTHTLSCAALPLLVALSACAQPGDQSGGDQAAADAAGAMSEADVRQAVESANAEATRLIAAGDVAGFVEQTYTEDATILPPGGPKIEGHQGIIEFWQGAAEQLGIQGVELRTETVRPMGADMAYEIGSGTIQTAQGPHEAKYVVVWKRNSAGEWRWHVDIWNDAPQGDGTE